MKPISYWQGRITRAEAERYQATVTFQMMTTNDIHARFRTLAVMLPGLLAGGEKSFIRSCTQVMPVFQSDAKWERMGRFRAFRKIRIHGRLELGREAAWLGRYVGVSEPFRDSRSKAMKNTKRRLVRWRVLLKKARTRFERKLERLDRQVAYAKERIEAITNRTVWDRVSRGGIEL